MTLSDAAEIVRVFGPTFVALVAASVAGTFGYWQWRTAHDKVVLDLFEERFSLYWTVYADLSQILAGAGSQQFISAMLEINKAREKARFLFGPEVLAFIDESKFVAARYHGLQGEAESRRMPEEIRKAGVELEQRLHDIRPRGSTLPVSQTPCA